MRVVLDCNVLLSALIKRSGPPGSILEALIGGRFELALSSAIVDEYIRAARYPRVRRLIGLTDQDLDELMLNLVAASFWVEPEPSAATLIHADPSDDVYLLTAAEASADVIVSGDQHLLALRVYAGIPIRTPREFLDGLGRAK